MRTPAIILLCGIATTAMAQKVRDKEGPAGTISFGIRSSASLFNDGQSQGMGMGAGGQFRIRVADRVNTDWFYDYLTAPIGDFAHRKDQHIGWSVMYYVLDPAKKKRFMEPYVVVGHCFDYTLQKANRDPDISIERWSSAVQAGAGTHFNLSPRTDISFVGQYMVHLGGDVHADVHEGQVEFHRETGTSLEGHLLLHLSFNIKLFDAW